MFDKNKIIIEKIITVFKGTKFTEKHYKYYIISVSEKLQLWNTRKSS